MWTLPSTADGNVQRSEIACYACRKRKVRCDRETPQCRVCKQTRQRCDYPLKAQKPGPKIGSTQRPGRRCRAGRKGGGGRRLQPGGGEQLSPSPPTPLLSPEPDGDNFEPSQGEIQVSPARAVQQSENYDRRNSALNIHDLSFILHPCHEAPTPDRDNKDRSPPNLQKETFQSACEYIGLPPDIVKEMVQIYFRNMVAINLFHEPSFPQKLSSISSATQLCALLAAMLGYAARFCDGEGNGMGQLVPEDLQPEPLLTIAVKFIDRALAECDDEPPPISVLQALIITTHCQLTRGVHGRAWRSLGMCVRLSYELNLHLIDARSGGGEAQDDQTRWRDDEELRRAWWAVWEMDVFASTIRRTPTAIDWTQMETFLPMDDSYWFNDQPIASSFMERDPVQRWKSLQATGNNSPKAWFLVINSLMKDAQIISSPHGVPFNPQPSQRQWPGRVTFAPGAPRTEADDDISEQLEILANTVQCFTLALPAHLKYRRQYLGFEQSESVNGSSARQLHCGIYNIFIMTQLARLMIHRYDLFRETAIPEPKSSEERRKKPKQKPPPGLSNMDISSVRQYFEAADNILSIINRCCDEHIQHINPFLLSTIWLASAVQLVRKHVGGSSTKPCLIKSRFDVLYLTYKRCVDFWDAKTAMSQNLETIETQLENYFPVARSDNAALEVRVRQPTDGMRRRMVTSWIPDDPSRTTTEHTSQARKMGRRGGFSQDDNDIHQHGQPQSTRQQTMRDVDFQLSLSPQTMTTIENTSMANQPVFDMVSVPSGGEWDGTLNPALTFGTGGQSELEWRNPHLPVNVHELLSGLSTY